MQGPPMRRKTMMGRRFSKALPVLATRVSRRFVEWWTDSEQSDRARSERLLNSPLGVYSAQQVAATGSEYTAATIAARKAIRHKYVIHGQLYAKRRCDESWNP